MKAHRYHYLTPLLAVLFGMAAVAPAAGQPAIQRADQISENLLAQFPNALAMQNKVLRKVTTQSKDLISGQWTNSTETRFTHVGNLIDKTTSYTWQNGAWVPVMLSDNDYQGNLLTSTIIQSAVNGQLGNSFRTLYTYTGGLLTGLLEQEWRNGAWADVERTTNTFQGNLLTGGQTDTLRNGAWQPSSRFTLVQENGGVTETTQEWRNGAWENDTRTIYPNLTIQQLYDLLSSTLNGDVFQTGSAFAFLFPNTIEQEWKNGAWENESRITTTFSAGKATQILFEDWETDKWEPLQRTTATYSGDRISTVKIDLYDDDSSAWTTFTTETHSYDAEGYLAQILNQVSILGFLMESRSLFEWGNPTTATDRPETPTAYRLDAAYPNPFNPSTRFEYHLESAGAIAIRVFDPLGRQVATLFEGTQPAGTHTLQFEASGLPSGTYFVRLEAAGFNQTRSVTLLK